MEATGVAPPVWVGARQPPGVGRGTPVPEVVVPRPLSIGGLTRGRRRRDGGPRPPRKGVAVTDAVAKPTLARPEMVPVGLRRNEPVSGGRVPLRGATTVVGRQGPPPAHTPPFAGLVGRGAALAVADGTGLPRHGKAGQLFYYIYCSERHTTWSVTLWSPFRTKNSNRNKDVVALLTKVDPPLGK